MLQLKLNVIALIQLQETAVHLCNASLILAMSPRVPTTWYAPAVTVEDVMGFALLLHSFLRGFFCLGIQRTPYIFVLPAVLSGAEHQVAERRGLSIESLLI
jgi:hypothetical protein